MRLLVADDDVSVRNLVNLALEIRGFDVVSVRNGVEALEMIANSETAFKMVILDVTMPKLGGIDTLRQMRTVIGYEDVPVLFLTGNDDANVDDLPKHKC